MQIFSIKNEKLGFFNRPIYCESSNEALTYVQNVLMSDADRALRGLKGDLALYALGEIDFVSGKIQASKRDPLKICDLQDIFDSIPEESIPRDSQALLKLIEDLGKRVKEMEDTFKQPISLYAEMKGDLNEV